MSRRAGVFGLILLAGWLAAGDAAETVGPMASVKGADRDLLDEVRAIAGRVEALRGVKFGRPPLAVRAPEDLRESLAQIRAYNVLPRERLLARGRAWADLGLGGLETPGVLLKTLAFDLAGVGYDPTGRRLLVAPDRLTQADFEPRPESTASSTMLMATGVRPDEPLISHELLHVLQLERDGHDALTETTDQLLASSALAEGEANLLAIRYLFQGMGLANEVLEHTIDPRDFLGGELFPKSMAGASGPEVGLVEFVYLEGFARAVESYKSGGWAALDRARQRATTTRDVLHPERPPLGPRTWDEGAPPAPGLQRVDTDSLGEQVVFALVSSLSGKDNLALQAADGWVGDRLERWEGEPETGQGVTLWTTRWSSPEDVEDFVYALGRVLEARYPGRKLEPAGEGRRLETPERVFRVEPRALEVRLSIAPPASRPVAAPPTEPPRPS